MGTPLVRTTSLNFPNPSILKLRNFCVFSLEAHTTLLAVKRTHPVPSLSSCQRDYQFVVSGEKHTWSSFPSQLNYSLKKAINRVLDSIIVIIASVLETNYCLWGFYSLEAVWESRGTETLGSVRYSYYRYYEDIQKPSVNSFFCFLMKLNSLVLL